MSDVLKVVHWELPTVDQMVHWKERHLVGLLERWKVDMMVAELVSKKVDTMVLWTVVLMADLKAALWAE